VGNFSRLYTGPEQGALPASLTGTFIQGTDAATIQTRLQAAFDAIVAGAQRSVFDAELSAAGDGNTFMVTLDTFIATPPEPLVGPILVRVIEGTSESELAAKYAAVVAQVVALGNRVLTSTATAGSSKGTRFMRVLIFEVDS
jgi:hypothetical protein